MKDNQAKYPQLRFKCFTDPWKQRKLGEEAQLTMGQSPNSENYTKNPDDYILVQGNADMKNGRVVPRVWTTQITKKAEKSDLILSVRAPVGDIGKTDYDVVLGRGVAAIKGNEFIFQQLGKMKLTGYWTRYSTGSTFESINSNDIKDAKIMVPVEEEQQKIGSFFKQLDNTIALHQRKLAKLKELKQGYLQKLFPKNGCKFPQLRFAGFADAWEQRKLSDAVDNIGTGKSKYMLQEKSDLAKYEVLGSTSVIGYDEDYDHEGDFILTARVGANAGNLYHHSGKVKITDNTVFIQGKNLAFIYNLLTQFDLKKLSFGTGQPLVKASELKNLILYFPNNDEQAKIGSYFKQLDHLITLHQRKLEKLQELKKGYLQKMFC
ncbi:restriction endonuclease subunit S [Lactiplantibacillus plantarum]|uniref:restriction endonuclease subunit S n=1 Tax=Lactiplantibacillus plantarum TaxID=1590 RepID=UPI00293C72C5|nr:restriction endonuclease subunit S [Lactiplantibacillus plantarum]MDV3526191.1 restriction endonuclease subunit S [Lactiplantibacillus plantarum]